MSKKDGPCVLARKALRPLWDLCKRFGSAGRPNGLVGKNGEKNSLAGTNIFLTDGNNIFMASEQHDLLSGHPFLRVKETNVGLMAEELIRKAKIPYTKSLVAGEGYRNIFNQLNKKNEQ
jgi:hypothetical protein